MTEANGKQIRPHRVPKEWRTPPANPGSLILILGGILFACVGVVMAAGTEFVGALQPYVTMAARYGVEAGTFFVGGAVIIGLGIVSRYQRISSKRLLQDGPTSDALEEVFTELAEILEHVDRLQSEQTHVRHEIGNVKHQVTKQREESKTSDSKDALFRLAASLDQLGARLDQRIGKASSEVHEGLYELTSIVESSRDFIQESLEATTREVRDVADRASRLASAPVQPVYLPHPGMYPPQPMPGPSEPREGEEYEVPAEDPDSDSNNYEMFDQEEEEEKDEREVTNAEDELRVLVELEEEEEAEPVRTGLGLLDELDDFGERTEPEPAPEPEPADTPPVSEHGVAPTAEPVAPAAEPVAPTAEPVAPTAGQVAPPPPAEHPGLKLPNPVPPLPSPTPQVTPPRPLGTLDEGMRGKLDQIKTLLEGQALQNPAGPPTGGPPTGGPPTGGPPA